MDKSENKIPKEIIEAFSTPMPEIMPKMPSNLLFYTKNTLLPSIEDLEKEEEKEEDCTEYRIGNYLVKFTLGKGTFGKVKLGIYTLNNETVAIKILDKMKITEKDDVIRVKREFDMLAKFNHPNVILVLEIFESEDNYYSVMEYCEGGELFN